MYQATTRTQLTRLTQFLAASTILLALAATNVAAEDAVAHGTFSGLSDHVTTGGVSIVHTADGVVVKLADDFSLDGAPDAKVGFGSAGTYDTKSQLAPLKSITGAQSYVVPASIDVGKYDEVYIWCEQFSVPLGVAQIRSRM